MSTGSVEQTRSQSSDIMLVPGINRAIMLVPTFQQGYVPGSVDGFRFTLVAIGATLMPTKIFRYRLVPSRNQPVVDQPPVAVEYLGFFDGVCSPADLEDFPEDYPIQNARPPWYRLDYIDLIVRSRSVADDAYRAILGEVSNLVQTLEIMDRQATAAPVLIASVG